MACQRMSSPQRHPGKEARRSRDHLVRHSEVRPAPRSPHAASAWCRAASDRDLVNYEHDVHLMKHALPLDVAGGLSRPTHALARTISTISWSFSRHSSCSPWTMPAVRRSLARCKRCTDSYRSRQCEHDMFRRSEQPMLRPALLLIRSLSTAHVPVSEAVDASSTRKIRAPTR